MAHTELDIAERRRIEDLLHAKASVSEIARDLGRHRSSIYREIKRNCFVDDELPQYSGYYGVIAQKIAAERRLRRRKLMRLADLRAAIIDRLKNGWSPEQIAGRLRLEHSPITVCHETIYAHVYSRDGQSEDLARWLPQRRKRRKPRAAGRPRDLVFPETRSIHNRREKINDRSAFGHWEADLMIFRRAHGPANVASMIERKTRFSILLRNPDRRSRPLMDRIITTLFPLPQPARQSITFDRGLEFVSWRRLKDGMNADAWFCDPQAPWQKGAVENLNQRARRWLPRDTNVASLSRLSMRRLCDQLNATPRKCLGYRTPAEAFAAELRKLE